MHLPLYFQNHTHVKKVAQISEFLLMNFEKPEKSEFWKNVKNTWRFHHFTHVYQNPQSYEVQFLSSNFFVIFFLSFWAIFWPLVPLATQKNKLLNKWKASGYVINLCNKKHDQMMNAYCAYSDTECDIRHATYSKIKIWKKCKKHPETLFLYTSAP